MQATANTHFLLLCLLAFAIMLLPAKVEAQQPQLPEKPVLSSPASQSPDAPAVTSPAPAPASKKGAFVDAPVNSRPRTTAQIRRDRARQKADRRRAASAAEQMAAKQRAEEQAKLAPHLAAVETQLARLRLLQLQAQSEVQRQQLQRQMSGLLSQMSQTEQALLWRLSSPDPVNPYLYPSYPGQPMTPVSTYGAVPSAILALPPQGSPYVPR
jgi:hypothetical protein